MLFIVNILWKMYKNSGTLCMYILKEIYMHKEVLIKILPYFFSSEFLSKLILSLIYSTLTKYGIIVLSES